MAAPPLYICTGTLRSGSTWSYNVCRLLGQELSIQRREPFGCAYLLDDELERFLHGYKVAPAPGPTVLKAHTVGPLALEYIQSGKLRAVCTYRDPRDCVVSMRTFFGGNLQDVAVKIAGGLDFLKLYQISPHTLFVRYEEMMANPHEQIRRIASHMNVKVPIEVLRRIEQQTSIESSRQICQDLKTRPETGFRRAGTHRVDPATCLHDNHIYSAQSGRWRAELTTEEANVLTKLFRPWLLRMGYETTESLGVAENARYADFTQMIRSTAGN